jgi:hypothetical protein
MGLNPNYTEEHDWEVVSATGSDDQSSLGDSEEEQDLILDDDASGMHQQLLPSSPGSDTEQNDLLQPNLKQVDAENNIEEQDGVNQESSANVQADAAVQADADADADVEETTPLISESHDLTDTVVVSNADVSKDEEPKVVSDASQDSKDEPAPPPPSEEARGPQKFVASLGASVKHLGDAIGKEGQKIGAAVQKEGHKIGSSIQKESQKLGKAIGDETKRIGQATQRVFQPRRSPSPPPSHASPRPRPEHSPTRDGTACVAEEEPSSLLATVLTGAAVLAGGIMLARGNKGAGAALLATGGATYMVNEAAKESRRFDTNLNEELGMHMN